MGFATPLLDPPLGKVLFFTGVYSRFSVCGAPFARVSAVKYFCQLLEDFVRPPYKPLFFEKYIDYFFIYIEDSYIFHT